MASVVQFRTILWCTKDGHDKVWTSFTIGPIAYCAWGKRGGKLQFKKHGMYVSALEKLEDEKQNKKGYAQVDKFLLFSMFPDFENKVEKELMMDSLTGHIK